MRRTLIVLALLAAVPAQAADRRYAVTDFDRVVVEGPYVVRLMTGRPSAASASGSIAALDRLSIDVNGQTLRIRRNRSHWGGNPGTQEGPLTIELATRTLRAARLVGPARLEVDRIQGLQVNLSVEGSGLLRVRDVRADSLGVGLAGGGRLELAGRAARLTADLQGTGDVDAAGLRAENATITAATSGTVSLTAGRAATVNAFGLGTVNILGRPACTIRGPSAALVTCGPAS